MIVTLGNTHIQEYSGARGSCSPQTGLGFLIGKCCKQLQMPVTSFILTGASFPCILHRGNDGPKQSLVCSQKMWRGYGQLLANLAVISSLQPLGYFYPHFRSLRVLKRGLCCQGSSLAFQWSVSFRLRAPTRSDAL